MSMYTTVPWTNLQPTVHTSKPGRLTPTGHVTRTQTHARITGPVIMAMVGATVHMVTGIKTSCPACAIEKFKCIKCY